MTKLVAIVNVTPDSFSDGGAHFSPDAALAGIERFISEGAEVIDIGAESTRPGATPLSPAQEWARLERVLSRLPRAPGVLFSVDTRHSETARKAVASGVDWINDVSGFSQPDMIEAVENSGCRLVVMHSLGVPPDKSLVMPPSADIVADMLAWGSERLRVLAAAGIARERIILDPGIGFGKTPAQSLALILGIKRLSAIGVPLLLGHSRKSFLSLFAEDRDEATLAVSRYLADEVVAYLRVHDVAAHRRMLEASDD